MSMEWLGGFFTHKTRAKTELGNYSLRAPPKIESIELCVAGCLGSSWMVATDIRT